MLGEGFLCKELKTIMQGIAISWVYILKYIQSNCVSKSYLEWGRGKADEETGAGVSSSPFCSFSCKEVSHGHKIKVLLKKCNSEENWSVSSTPITAKDQ